MGGSLGISAAGTIFANTLESYIGIELAYLVSENPTLISNIENKNEVIIGVSKSLGAIYYYSIPLTFIIFVSNIFVQDSTLAVIDCMEDIPEIKRKKYYKSRE